MSDNIEINIRPATSKDAEAISTILQELGDFNHVDEEPLADTKRSIVRHLKLCNSDESHTVLLAENQDGEVIGYTAVHWLPYLILAGPEGYVSELFVCRSNRGRGVGSRLLEAVKEQAIKRGCTRLSLLNMRSRKSYERGFYRKLGWEERDAANFVLSLQREARNQQDR